MFNECTRQKVAGVGWSKMNILLGTVQIARARVIRFFLILVSAKTNRKKYYAYHVIINDNIKQKS